MIIGNYFKILEIIKNFWPKHIKNNIKKENFQILKTNRLFEIIFNQLFTEKKFPIIL